MRVAIIDNGKGAQQLEQLISGSTIFPSKDFKKALNGNFDAYVITDGEVNAKNQKAVVDFLNSVKKPVLAIGFGYLCLGALMGADVVECKPVKKNSMLSVKHGSPLTTDMKRINVRHEFNMKLANIPQEILDIASTSEADIIQDIEMPFIGVNFLPEKSKDGPQLIKNFLKFAEVYDQYHA